MVGFRTAKKVIATGCVLAGALFSANVQAMSIDLGNRHFIPVPGGTITLGALPKAGGASDVVKPCWHFDPNDPTNPVTCSFGEAYNFGDQGTPMIPIYATDMVAGSGVLPPVIGHRAPDSITLSGSGSEHGFAYGLVAIPSAATDGLVTWNSNAERCDPNPGVCNPGPDDFDPAGFITNFSMWSTSIGASNPDNEREIAGDGTEYWACGDGTNNCADPLTGADQVALDAANGSTLAEFKLPVGEEVFFWIEDPFPGDNLGGLTFAVVILPEPHVHALLGMGFLATAYLSRKRIRAKRKTA